jgi:hypothetical protein
MAYRGVYLRDVVEFVEFFIRQVHFLDIYRGTKIQNLDLLEREERGFGVCRYDRLLGIEWICMTF